MNASSARADAHVQDGAALLGEVAVGAPDAGSELREDAQRIAQELRLVRGHHQLENCLVRPAPRECMINQSRRETTTRMALPLTQRRCQLRPQHTGPSLPDWCGQRLARQSTQVVPDSPTSVLQCSMLLEESLN